MSGSFRSWVPPLAACLVLLVGVAAAVGWRLAGSPVVATAYADLPSAELALPPAPAAVEPATPPEPPAVPDPSRPAVALVVTGLGLAARPTAAAIALPEAVALAFSPYARDLRQGLAEAAAAGHEVLLELPVEPADTATADAGPLALHSELDGQALAARVQDVVGGNAAVAGAVAEAGGFAARPDRFAGAAAALAARGLVLLQLGGEELGATARDVALPFAAVEGPLDAELDPVAIDRSLAALEAEARSRGFAVGFVRPYPLSLERVARWAAGLPAAGLNLVAPGRRLRAHGAEASAG
ncbi:MAG: divergent polysaccharide deacetylase family protein [Geminicoccaceae bacterium]